MNWDIVLRYIVPVVISAVISLVVCILNNKQPIKMERLKISEKNIEAVNNLKQQHKEQTRSALSSYLMATGKYIASPNEETFKGWCEIKDAIYLYAPANTHKQLDELNEKLLNYETPDWARFCNRQMIANALLTDIGKKFATFMNIDQ